MVNIANTLFYILCMFFSILMPFVDFILFTRMHVVYNVFFKHENYKHWNSMLCTYVLTLCLFNCFVCFMVWFIFYPIICMYAYIHICVFGMIFYCFERQFEWLLDSKMIQDAIKVLDKKKWWQKRRNNVKKT